MKTNVEIKFNSVCLVLLLIRLSVTIPYFI